MRVANKHISESESESDLLGHYVDDGFTIESSAHIHTLRDLCFQKTTILVGWKL